MPVYEFDLPNGTTYQARGETPQEAWQSAVDQVTSQSSVGNQIGRSAGLVARSGMEGAAMATAGGPAFLADVGYGAVQGARQAMGDENAGSVFEMPATSAVLGVVDDTADAVGLPQPVTERERFWSAVTGGVASGLSAATVGRAVQHAARNAGRQSVEKLGRGMASRPGTQAAAGGAAGGAAERADQVGMHPAVSVGAGTLAGLGVAGARSGFSAAQEMTRPMRQSGREQMVANHMAKSASNPERLPIGDPKAAQSFAESIEEYVPGSQPTTAQVSGDPGLLRLERGLSRRPDTADAFSKRYNQSLAARNSALDDVTPTKDQHDASKAARRDFNEAEIDRVFDPDSVQAADITNVTRTIDRLMFSPDARSEPIKKALKYARRQMDGISRSDRMEGGKLAAAGSGRADARQLFVARKNIMDLFKTKDFLESTALGRDKSAQRAAYSRIKPIIEEIDNSLTKANPEYADYMQKSRELAEGVDQGRAMREIRRKVTANRAPTAEGGQESIIGSQLRKILRDRVDGDDFSRLNPEQQKTLQNVLKDLDRGLAAEAPDVRAAGSNTMPDFANSGSVSQVLTSSPGANLLARTFQHMSEEQIAHLMAEAVADPQVGLRMLAKANPRNLEQTLSALSRLSVNTAGKARDAGAGLSAGEDQ